MGFLGCSKGSKGRSAHAPEPEIDPNRRHLDIVPAGSESVADQEWGPNWNDECSGR
jgi:hypothetical protein